MRGYSCGDRDGVDSGTTGIAHVSCLAEQAKILFAECEENNLGDTAFLSRFERWQTCSLCEQRHHGVVLHALGWACWKTYVGQPETRINAMVRPEADMARINAMTALGNGLDLEGKFEERLAVFKSQLAMLPRVGASQEHVLGNQGNTATCLSALGRYEEAMKITVRIYSGMKALNGPRNEFTILSAANLASSLEDNERKAAALSLAAEYLPIAESVLGPHDIPRHYYVETPQMLFTGPNPNRRKSRRRARSNVVVRRPSSNSNPSAW